MMWLLQRIIGVAAIMLLLLVSLLLTNDKGTKWGDRLLQQHEQDAFLEGIFSNADQGCSDLIREKEHSVIVDRHWCHHARCYENHMCHTCERRFLIVITSGRSASTTLTWMLNALPNVRMSGENNDAIKKLKNMIDGTLGFWQVTNTNTPGKDPWGHYPFPQGTVPCVVQTAIEALNPPKNVTSVLQGTQSNKKERAGTILGFKTIRLQEQLPWGDIPKVVKFVKDSFPCARFVVNYRSNTTAEAESVEKSWHVSSNESEVIARYELGNKFLFEIASELGSEQAYLLDSTQWTKNVTVLNELIHWLGFNQYCDFSEVLEYNTHGYKNGNTKLDVNPKCKYKYSL